MSATQGATRDFARELATAQSIARRAGEILTSHFGRRDLETRQKSYLDVVTAADTRAEEMIAAALRWAFPNDAVVGEEGTASAGAGSRVWYVDPLDGTFNYARGIPFWCTSIGLAEERKPMLGVVFDPLRDELFSAIDGMGTCLNGTPIESRGVTNPMAATVQLSISFDRAVIGHSMADFNAIAPNVMRVRNMGALALELAYLAAGRLDAVVQRGSHAWDYAAGSLIAREAGATMTSLDGSAFGLSTRDTLVAATPELHRALASMLRGTRSLPASR